MSGPRTKASCGWDQGRLGGGAKESCMTAEGSAETKSLQPCKGFPLWPSTRASCISCPRGGKVAVAARAAATASPPPRASVLGPDRCREIRPARRRFLPSRFPGSSSVPAIVSPRRPPAPDPATGPFPGPGSPPLEVVPGSAFGSDPPACPQLQTRFLNWPLELRIFARSPRSLRCCLGTRVLVLPVAPRASVLRPNPRVGPNPR